MTSFIASFLKTVKTSESANLKGDIKMVFVKLGYILDAYTPVLDEHHKNINYIKEGKNVLQLTALSYWNVGICSSEMIKR